MPRGRARKEKCLLKGKADEFVNGYCHGGVRAYRKSGKEYEANDYDNPDMQELQNQEELDRAEQELTEAFNKHDIMEEMDIYSPSFQQLLTSNSTAGFYARTRCIRNILPEWRKTDNEGNEAGWINEYWFGKVILPNKYGIVDWEPSIEKYYDLDIFQDPWDFHLSNLSIEVKTQGIGTYTSREYICPESKLDALKTDDFAIWWSKCKSASEVIEGRDSPMPVWKYYENKKTIWDTYDKIPRPLKPNQYLIGNKSTKQLMVNTQAILKPPTYLDSEPGVTSDQLYFQLPVLKDYNP
jgi:hypothetical protein